MSDLLDKMNLNGDQKKQYNKVKHDLEVFREVILIFDSILKWENKIFPGIIFASISIAFCIMWYLNLSILTAISLDLLFITIIDYGYPIVSKFVFKSENWNGIQEKKFESVCHEIVTVINKIKSGYKCIFNAKEEKSTMYIIFVSSILMLLAWIGSTFDNLFLGYITTLFLGFYPGLLHHGIVAKAKDTIKTFAGSHLKNIMPKSKEPKNE